MRPAVGHRLGRGEGRDVVVEARYRRQAVVVIEGCAAVGAARSGSKLAASRKYSLVGFWAEFCAMAECVLSGRCDFLKMSRVRHETSSVSDKGI